MPKEEEQPKQNQQNMQQQNKKFTQKDIL